MTLIFRKRNVARFYRLKREKGRLSSALDNAVLDYFRAQVDRVGGGNYQTLINDALVAHIHQQSLLAAVRQVIREELTPANGEPHLTKGARRSRPAPAER